MFLPILATMRIARTALTGVATPWVYYRPQKNGTVAILETNPYTTWSCVGYDSPLSHLPTISNLASHRVALPSRSLKWNNMMDLNIR